jgi:hypothetical protein
MAAHHGFSFLTPPHQHRLGGRANVCGAGGGVGEQGPPPCRCKKATASAACSHGRCQCRSGVVVHSGP